MRHRCAVGFGFASLVVLAGSALGQEAPPRDDKRPPLQGPPVKESRAPHVEDQFTDGMRPQGRMGPQIPMRAYAEVIGTLRGDKAPADLRLSEEQERKLGAIEQEYRDATRAYAQQQREQRGEGQPRRGPGEGNQANEPRRERAQEMMRNGPRMGDFQTRIWAVLNEKQQAHVKVGLDKVRDDLQQRRSEEMMQRRLDQQKAGKPQEAGQPGRPAAGPDGDARPLRERAMRLMRRLGQLPESERDQLLGRIEAELDRRGIPDVAETDMPMDRKPADSKSSESKATDTKPRNAKPKGK